VNAIIPPAAIDGPIMSIRRFRRSALSIDQLLEFGTLGPEMAEFLMACIKSRLNMLITGGTGSGKTTVLNILSRYIPHNERVVTIEDSAELMLQQPHVVRLETRPPNIEAGARSRSAIWCGTRCACARPHRRRRGARRRGARHAPGHEHRPRRLAHHAALERPARRAAPAREPGAHVGHRAARPRDPRAGLPLRSTSCPRLAPCGTAPARCSRSELVGMEGGRDDAGDLPFVPTGQDEDGKIRGDFEATGMVPRCMERLRLPASRCRPPSSSAGAAVERPHDLSSSC
jgi:pilus assembly protein CpaF